MSAVEELRAAVGRLEALKAAPDYHPDFHPELGTKEDFDLAVEKTFTLHSTITAQLGILHAALSEIHDWTLDAEMGHKAERMFKIGASGRAALELARAINGVDAT